MYFRNTIAKHLYRPWCTASLEWKLRQFAQGSLVGLHWRESPEPRRGPGDKAGKHCPCKVVMLHRRGTKLVSLYNRSLWAKRRNESQTLQLPKWDCSLILEGMCKLSCIAICRLVHKSEKLLVDPLCWPAICQAYQFRGRINLSACLYKAPWIEIHLGGGITWKLVCSERGSNICW